MDIVSLLLTLVLLVVSLGVHECAHAWAAYKFGDDTAARMGRMTLNPIPHIDPFGLLPILLGVPIGWAKPVPVNPMRVKNPSIGLPLIAAAGPISNILQMILGAILHFVFFKFAPVTDLETLRVIAELFEKYISINLALALFNMFPIYPLDGSKVISIFLPPATADRYEASIQRLGYFPLIILFVANSALNGKILGFWFELWMPLFEPIFRLLSISF